MESMSGLVLGWGSDDSDGTESVHLQRRPRKKGVIVVQDHGQSVYLRGMEFDEASEVKS